MKQRQQKPASKLVEGDRLILRSGRIPLEVESSVRAVDLDGETTRIYLGPIVGWRRFRATDLVTVIALLALVLGGCAGGHETPYAPHGLAAAGAGAPELYEPGRVVRGELPVIDHVSPERDCVDRTPITVVGENLEPGAVAILRYPFHAAELEPLETRWSTHRVVQFEIDPEAQWAGMPRWTDGYYTIQICGITGCSNEVEIYREICVDASDWGQ